MTVTWTTACPDWADRLINQEPIVPTILPSPQRAARALKIFKRLRLVDVPGAPRLDEICADWVFQFVAAVFGAFDDAEQRQIVREAMLLTAKKSSKSSIAAGVMVTALIMHRRQQEEFTIIAPTRSIADNSFDPARGMIEADEALRKRFKVSAFTREIEDRLDGATLSVKAADADVIGGQKATCVLVDELWLFGRKAGAENIISEAAGSLVARVDGFVVYLTSQSDEPPAGVFRKRLDYHRKVRDGIIRDPTTLPAIYEFPPAMIDDGSWREPANWYIPNPNLGRSVDFDWLVATAQKAEHQGGDSFGLFAAKHLCVEVGIALRSDAWGGVEYWQDRADPSLTLETLIERSDAIVAGVDGGGLDDLLALAVIGRDAQTHEWLLWNRTWCHPIVLERRKSEASRLLDFAAGGELVIVDRIGDDVQEIADVCDQLNASNKLAQIGLDPQGVGNIVDALEAKGIKGDRLVAISQGWRLAGSIKTLERRLAEGTVTHAAQGIVAWSVGNCKVEPKGSAISITKQTAGAAKIDPIAAAFTATAVMITNPKPVPKSIVPSMYFVGGRRRQSAGMF